MKIISGKYKGRKIEGFNISGTRPTMDRVKESLFAIINNYLEDSIILDLFSGSGNLAIESISQGAGYAYLVDNNKDAIRTINNNIKNIGIEEAEVIKADYKDALKLFKDKKFDLIFLDPPYNSNYIEEALILIDKYNLLSDTGIIICESDQLEKIIYSSKYESFKERKYGDKYIVILKKI